MVMRLMKTERGGRGVRDIYSNMVYVSAIVFDFFHRKSCFRDFRHCTILFFCGIALPRVLHLGFN